MLSSREQAVLELLAAGFTKTEIAEKLFMSEGTVSTHLYGRQGCPGIFERLGARNAAHAVSLGYRFGLLKVRRPIVNVQGPDSMRWSA